MFHVSFLMPRCFVSCFMSGPRKHESCFEACFVLYVIYVTFHALGHALCLASCLDKCEQQRRYAQRLVLTCRVETQQDSCFMSSGLSVHRHTRSYTRITCQI